MEISPSYVGPRCFTVVVMVVMLLFTGNLQLTEAQTRCDPVELSWCLQAIVSNIPPSRTCCRKLKGQEACLCREKTDPTFGAYLGLPGAKRVAAACGVTFPNC
ncbi:Bifunctional inhibitor/plant lipid transfer protein/seed storage helical domain-containing protein [Cynara cardunculus var. scolymus]|uniref:Bifunctional inhibitor/plant lipid transfer protein/seed storage helical domain-containing protein n=1 Tax=Cynara cardunculus var. scolymus TaxID=59895 RepID=A0A103Y099_CYNCS|nr:Bifunctional inhibitor/plant lipid transfer protein/seed storage helical domain-containing protein [Cynara cardunculus var. scolymus]